MTVLQRWNLVLMLVIVMASFKISEGCIPPPPPRCVGKPSETQLTSQGEPCIFPFKYESTEYSQCAEIDGVEYCATEINKDCTYKRLGICAGSGSHVCFNTLKNKTKINGGVNVHANTVLPFQAMMGEVDWT